ncbi:MAG: transporter substrate-binding domain-containing protein, partial [Desulfobacterales bacterium]|nr:transporter substrate-binding domain-containing protein [Desulfobacterales bacterium]
FFHLKDKVVQWDSWDDLKTFKIGVMASDFTETLLKEKGLKVEAVQESDANFKKVLAKRIDLYPTSLLVGYHSIHNLFPAEKAALFTNNPKPLKEDDMFIMFSKQAGPRFLDLFVDGLRKLKASGRYDAIMNEVTSGD